MWCFLLKGRSFICVGRVSNLRNVTSDVLYYTVLKYKKVVFVNNAVTKETWEKVTRPQYKVTVNKVT